VVECAYCNIETKNAKYCSLECSYKGIGQQSKLRRLREYDEYRRFCKVCSNALTRQQHMLGNIYCNRSCAKVETNKAPSRIRKKHTRCKNCNESFRVYATSGLFCSGQCFHDNRFLNETIPLIREGKISSSRILKKYLSQTCGEHCTICGQGPSHHNKPLCLQLDHIDGDADNNFPANLRLLCPNCHTQTDTYCGGNPQSRRNLLRQEWRSRQITLL
jgi:hypothetical protein